MNGKQRGRLDILYFGMTTWDGITGRAKQLATRLGSVGRVCFVDPITPSLPGNLLRLARGQSTRPWRTRLEHVSDGLWVLTPHPALPWGYDLGFLNRANQGLVSRLVRRTARQVGLEDPILWIEHPLETAQISSLDHRMVCYHCRDNYRAFWSEVPRRQKLVERLEEQLLPRADVVVAASEALAELCGRANPHIYAVPNAADFEHFAAGQGDRAPELDDNDHPLVGYLGTVSHWFDLDAIHWVAQRRPAWTFVIIGPVENVDLTPYQGLANLHFMGAVPYARAPDLAAAFDVCLLPRRTSELTAHMDPIKVYEYLSLGKPVVASPMPQLERYADLIYLANDGTAFEACIEMALAEAHQPGATAKREARKALAQANTWDRRVEDILNALRETDRRLGWEPEY